MQLSQDKFDYLLKWGHQSARQGIKFPPNSFVLNALWLYETLCRFFLFFVFFLPLGRNFECVVKCEAGFENFTNEEVKSGFYFISFFLTLGRPNELFYMSSLLLLAVHYSHVLNQASLFIVLLFHTQVQPIWAIRPPKSTYLFKIPS